MSNHKLNIFLLIIILTIAFVLRVWGVNFGLPELFHFDERVLSFNALYALANKGKLMSAYHYGTLIPYLLDVLYAGYYIILKIMRVANTAFDFLVLYMKDPTNVYLIGRTFFVICSTFCVFVMYLLSRKIYGNAIAIIATSLFGFSFLPIQQAKFMKGDTLGTLFLLLAFYFVVPGAQNGISQKPFRGDESISGRPFSSLIDKNYIFAGIFMGLAIAARFTLCIAPFSIAFICLSGKSQNLNKRIKNCLILGVFTIIAFLIVTPALLFDYKNFMASIYYQLRDTRCNNINPGSLPVWLFYLTEHLHKGIGLPLELISILGIFYSLYRRKNIEFIIFLILFFCFILNHPLNYERYLIPIIPFFIMFAANFIYRVVSKLKVPLILRNTLTGVVTAVLILPNLLNAIKYDYLITRPDTRSIARKFIESTIPMGSKIVSESGSPETIEQTSHLGVQLHKSKQQLQEQLVQAEKEGRPGRHIKALIQGQSEPTYILENVLILEKENYAKKECYKDVNSYLEKGIEYLITSSWAQNQYTENDLPEDFRNSLESRYEIIKEFNPYPVFKWDYYSWRLDYKALSKVSMFDKNVVGGPIISIYKIRNMPSEKE